MKLGGSPTKSELENGQMNNNPQQPSTWKPVLVTLTILAVVGVIYWFGKTIISGIMNMPIF